MEILEVKCVPVVHGVPESHWGATFGNFDFSDQPELKELTLKFLDGERLFWLYLSGPTGRGKTHYAVALHRALVARSGHLGSGSSVFSEWVALCEDLRGSFEDYSYDARLAAYLESRVLILDDVIGRQTDFQVKVLTQIIRDRYANQKSLVVTSNESLDWFRSLFSAHEVSRIESLCVGVRFGGVDRRSQE